MKKVFVGVSGGVDSALTLSLLKERGYDVTAVFIKVWHPDFLICNWREERRDAMRVAAKNNVPFLFFDFEEEYKKHVAMYMINEYKLGRTPNPDILCNKVIKFGSFWEKAKSLGADFIATGHYAKIVKNNEKYYLLEGNDKEKDQSYFLWMLNQNDLAHVLMPIGEYSKKEVREMAHKRNIPVAEKKDSQGICFMGDIDLEEFLSHFIKTKKGNVLDVNNNVIGVHNGAIYYTIGERRGFIINIKTPDDKPFYVIEKNIDANTITVSNNPKVISGFSPKGVVVENVNWINSLNLKNCLCRIRYRQEKIPVEVEYLEKSNTFNVKFNNNQKGVSIGQSIVFYDENICLGGGIIENKNI